MQGVFYADSRVRLYTDILGMVGYIPQRHILLPHFGGVAAWHIGGQHDPAEQRIDRGKLFLLLRGQLAVFFPQEKHVRVAAVGAPVELAAKDRVADALLCGHALAVEKPHIPHIVPVKPHIAADAAVIRHAEGGHNRHTAAQNQLVAA